MAKHAHSPKAVAETIKQHVKPGMVIQLRNFQQGDFEEYTVEKIRTSGVLEVRNENNAFRLVKPKHTLKALNLHFSQLEQEKAETEKQAAEMQEKHQRVKEGNFTPETKPPAKLESKCVKWEYSAGGKKYEREGTLVTTIPPNVKPIDVIQDFEIIRNLKYDFDDTKTATHERYLINSENRLYMPVVTKLIWVD